MTYLSQTQRAQLNRLPFEQRSAALAAIWTADGTPPNHDWRTSDEPEHLDARMAAFEWFHCHREHDALDPHNPEAREFQRRLDTSHLAVAALVHQAGRAADVATKIPTALCGTELCSRILGRPLRPRKTSGPCRECRKQRGTQPPAGHIAEDVGPGAYVLRCGGLWLD
jgi:hypothetical protein